METKEEMIDRTVKYILSYEFGEMTINESLHFGIELYAWKEDVIESNVPYIEGKNECFLHIAPENVKEYITYLYNRDGYLLIND